MNYFELYEMPITFKLDSSVVRKKYYALSRKFHPDTNGDDHQLLLEMSSKVNEAYALFQNQHDTLAYILKIKGVVVEGEKYQLPPDFLMEVMELNENLNDDVVANLQKEISIPVAQLLNTADVSLITDVEWQQLKLYYYQEKYINRLIQRNNGIEWFD